MSFSFGANLNRTLGTEHVNVSPSPSKGAAGTLQSREVRVLEDSAPLLPSVNVINLPQFTQGIEEGSWPLKKRLAFDHQLSLNRNGLPSLPQGLEVFLKDSKQKEKSKASDGLHEDPQVASFSSTLSVASQNKMMPDVAMAATSVVEEESDSASSDEGVMHPLPKEFVLDQSRIRPINILGCGSYGYVHEALMFKKDAKEPLRVAIKVNKLFQDEEVHQDYLQVLTTEAEILSRLQRIDVIGQRAIARFISSGYVASGCFCLVQELYEKDIVCLLDHHQRSQRLSIKDISKIAFQLLDALGFLKHPSINIIHCDLKPQNIFLENERDYRVRIGDFGSAKVGPQENHEGEYLITRWYRPPELAFKLPFHFSADIWSLGCIMYEMFTLHPIFPARDEDQLLKMVYEFLGVAPNSFVTKIPGHEIFFEPTRHYPGYCHLRAYAAGPLENRREVSKRRLSFDPSKVKDRFDTEQNYKLFNSFLHGMLTWDGAERPTPEKLLSHPFIKQLEGAPAAAGAAAAAAEGAV